MPDAPKTTPPAWVTDGSFEPEKAWSLIENLRTEVADLKTKVSTVADERDVLKAKVDEASAAEQTAAERAQSAAEAAEQRAAAAERALWTERALRKHPFPEGLSEEDEADLLAFLSGDSAEEIERKAARLAALRGTPKAEETEEDAEGQEPEVDASGRPKPALTPGHGGTTPEPFDPAAVAKAARESR